MTLETTRWLAAAVLALVLSAGPAFAAEDSDEPSNGQEAPAEPSPQKDDDEDGPDIFRPSEEISEDFSVAFPVDI